MQSQPIHILNQMGVISSFSVAKKMEEKDINKYFEKCKRKGIAKSDAAISKMLQDEILEEINIAVLNNKVPGLITPAEFAKSVGVNKNIIEKIPEISRLILIISHKLKEKKYDKMSLCYFINSLVNMLGLTERDFLKFHKENKVNNNDEAVEDSYEEDDEDSYEEDEDDEDDGFHEV